LVGLEKNPLENVIGEEIGKMMTNEHTKNGVKLHMG
jgi:hypothetical protein